MNVIHPAARPAESRNVASVSSPRRAHHWVRLAVAACAFLFASAPTPGQGTPATSESPRLASIHGTLSTTQDNTSAGLGGITVKLIADPPTGSAMTADTADDGRYEFNNLKPGSYQISISQPGFKPFAKSLAVNPAQAAVVDIRVEFETVSEKVEVNEQAQAIATESASTPSETVTQRELLALPTAQEKIREVLPVTPGVVKTQDGKLSFKGADENQSLMLVNSARTGDPVSGTFSIPVPTDAVQSFAVYKTPYDAGLGSFSGGLTTVETKPPEDQWNYRLRNFIPSVLGKNGSMVGIAEATPGFDFGGPLLKHRLFFSEVFQYEMKKKTVRGLPWPNDISKRQGFDSFATFEAIFSQRHILTVTVNAFPVRQQHADINALVPQAASNDLNQKGIAVGLSDKYQSDSGIYSVTAAYTRFDSNAHGQGFADMLVTPEGWDGNFFNQWSRRGKEFQLMPSYQSARKHWFGHHEIHFGLDVDHRSYAGTSASDSVQLLREDASLAEAIHFQGAPLQNASDTAVAEFFQDHWILDSHWALDGGARFSSETSGWSAAFAPRVGVAFSPSDEGKTVLRAGAGLFYSALPLLAADFADNPTRVISQFDLSGQPSGLPVRYTNAYVGDVNPLSAGALPPQPGTTPRNFTWNAEVDRELRRNVSLRVSYIDSHTTYLFVIDPFTAVPGAESFLGLANTGSSHYRELSGTVRVRLRAHDEVNASYIRSETRGDLNNLSSVLIPFAQPVIRQNVYGILPSDVPNRVVTWGIFSLPKEFKFSPIADIHSGYPYSNIDVQQNYVGTPNGERFATYFSLDVKFYREFRVPFLGSSRKAHHVRLGFYSLNVTNHGNFNAVYNNVTAPRFGQFVGFLDRRDGAMIDFVD